MQKEEQKEITKIDSLENVTVPSRAMEKLLSVTGRRVRQLADEGILQKAGRGKYELASSVANYIKHLKINNDIGSHKVATLPLLANRIPGLNCQFRFGAGTAKAANEKAAIFQLAR